MDCFLWGSMASLGSISHARGITLLIKKKKKKQDLLAVEIFTVLVHVYLYVNV